EMSKVEFEKLELPKSPDELPKFLEATRQEMLQTGRISQERFAEVEKQLESAFAEIKKNEDSAKRISALEETIKALHEAGRIGNDEKLVRQLRSLPVMHKVERDEDYRGKVTRKVFNLLALSRAQLRTYLSGEALDWAMRVRRLSD